MNRKEKILHLKSAIETKRTELGLTEKDAPPILKSLIQLLRKKSAPPASGAGGPKCSSEERS